MLVFGIVSLNISCETLGESFQTWFSFLGNFLEMCVYTYTHLSVFLPSSQFFLDFLLVRCWVSGACFSRVIFSVIWAPRSYSLATKEASSCTRHQEARLQLRSVPLCFISGLEGEEPTLLACDCVLRACQEHRRRVVEKVHIAASQVRENQNTFLIFVPCFID